MNPLALEEMLHNYENPTQLKGKTEWVEWVFKLRRQNRRHALEFVEDWSGRRIAWMGFSQIVAATLVGVIWACRFGTVQDAFSVASFTLAVSAGEICFGYLPNFPTNS